MPDFDGIIEIMEGLPVFKWIVLGLKRMGFFKDHKRLYRTENHVKALGNSMKQIDVPFEKILHKRKIEIPCLILLRQKDSSNIFTSPKLRELGFKISGRTMGLYVLPPLKVIEHEIKDRESIKKFFEDKFGLNKDSKINLRFCVLTDLNKNHFSFRHDSIKSKETKPIFELINEDIIKYLGTKESLRYIKEYYKKEWKKKEFEIIQATPLQHIVQDYLDAENFSILAKKEKDILSYMKDMGYVTSETFLELSKVSKKRYKEILIEFIGEMEDIDAISQKIKDQAEFLANRL